MRNRCFRMVGTIATSATIACGDAAVDKVSAPGSAAIPSTPVANQWPYEWEYTEGGIPSAIGIQIQGSSAFTNDYRTFEVSARVTFQWVNDVSAKIEAWLLNKSGQTVNSGSAQMSYQRLTLPVPSGDTTFTVRIATNATCGLIGKASYEGSAAQVAIDARLVQVVLYKQTIGKTTLPDALQPECPPPSGCEEPVTRVMHGAAGVLASEGDSCGDASAPDGGSDEEAPEPPSGGDEVFIVCFNVLREYWYWDLVNDTYTLKATWLVATICYETTLA